MAILLAMMVIFTFTLVGCSGQEKPVSESEKGKSEQANSKYPEGPITVIVSYAAGGGTDVGARILQPFAEKELGTSLVIVNKPGGGGWVGWSELAKAKPDGYTIGFINTPNLMAGYLDPKLKRKENLNSFIPIINQVTDYGAIAVRPDSKFKTIQDVIKYAKENPGKLSVTSTGYGSDDHIAALKLAEAIGSKFEIIHLNGAADSRAQVLGGHVDILFANVGEVTTLHKEGQLRVLAVMSEKRSEFLPDVPTLKEIGYDIVSASARGIAAPAGTPQEIIDFLQDKLEKAIKNPEHIKKMAQQGLAVIPIKGDEYMKLLKKDEADVKKYMGW